MINYIKQLLKKLITIFNSYTKTFTCNHKWYRYRKPEIFYYSTDDMPTGTKDSFICEKCGEIQINK